MKRFAHTWSRLAHSARSAPLQSEEPPLGFATRVIANWRSQAAESAVDNLEWFAMRGMGIALMILLGSAAYGYNTIASMTTGDTTLAGSWLERLLIL